MFKDMEASGGDPAQHYEWWHRVSKVPDGDRVNFDMEVLCQTLLTLATACEVTCPPSANVTVNCPHSMCVAHTLDLHAAVAMFLTGLIIGGILVCALTTLPTRSTKTPSRSPSSTPKQVAVKQAAKARARAGLDGFGCQRFGDHAVCLPLAVS